MILSICLTFFLSSGWTAAANQETTFSTGKDWLRRMSPREKYISLLPPSLLFQRYDVRLKLSLPEYIGLIDHILLRNPQLKDEDVSNIFASTIYLFEPQNREALKTMEMGFLSGSFEPSAYQLPHLTLEEILKEIS